MEEGLATDKPDNRSEHASPLAGRLNPVLAGLLALVAVAWAGEVPYRLGFVLYPEQVLVAILALGLALAFLGVSVRSPKAGIPWYDWLAASLGLAAGAYVAVRYPILADEFFFK